MLRNSVQQLAMLGMNEDMKMARSYKYASIEMKQNLAKNKLVGPCDELVINQGQSLPL